MAKEKAKAQKFSEQQISRKIEAPKENKLASMGQRQGNPLNLQKNLDGFAKQKGIVIGERVDNRAAEQQQRRAKELRDLI